MPTIAFGLNSNKKTLNAGGQSLKRKAAFDIEADDDDRSANNEIQGSSASSFKKKSPSAIHDESVTNDGLGQSKYSNLSALRNAKLQNEAASNLDSSVYDYDAVYDSFAVKDKRKKPNENGDTTVPKYMSNLLASAETRKRDQLRAKEKQLQRERELEGDEFADKEQFVTGAYKKQQEENRRLEEQEKLREQEEEERRRKGGGMTAFHKTVLAKDEERLKAVEAAQEQSRLNQSEHDLVADIQDPEDLQKQAAIDMKQKGANIVTNDDGEVIDKRQLLTAGLNVAPRKAATQSFSEQKTQDKRSTNHRSSRPSDARISQRERQSRMIEKQIEEMEHRQTEAEATERQAQENKNKSKLTESDKLSAKERYLQRKREREQEAKAGQK